MDNDKNENFENKIYFNKYKPEKKIGEGSFGKIYSCTFEFINKKVSISTQMKNLLLRWYIKNKSGIKKFRSKPTRI
jgi:hypothetical protein